VLHVNNNFDPSPWLSHDFRGAKRHTRALAQDGNAGQAGRVTESIAVAEAGAQKKPQRRTAAAFKPAPRRRARLSLFFLVAARARRMSPP
jgi:hypothetical protein